MSSGLRERAIILSPLITADAGGGFALTFDEGETVAVSTEAMSPRREEIAGRERIKDRRRFTFRSVDPLTTDHRLRFGAADYRIVAIKPEDDRDRYVTVTGEEVLP